MWVDGACVERLIRTPDSFLGLLASEAQLSCPPLLLG